MSTAVAETVIYFPQPQVQTIGEAAHPASSLTETNCRLKSSLAIEYRAFLPKTIDYELDQSPTSSQIRVYLEKMERQGFGEGAVVARRYGRPNQWKYPSQWGLLMFVRKHSSNHPFAPYCVRWFNVKDSFEDVWAEDLVVIHTCLSESLLFDIVEAQGVKVIRS